MTGQWYAWLVGFYLPEPAVDDGGNWAIRGVFTTPDAAREVALPGDFIVTLILDQPYIGRTELPVEWIE